MSLVIQVLRHYPFPVLASSALLIFVGVFVGAVASTWRRDAGRTQRRAAQLPLEDV